MARLRITVWQGNGGDPKSSACPTTAALVKALTARSRTDVTVVHCPEETPRKPTTWETKASNRLATQAASKMLPAVVVASPLPDELDSDLVAVSVPKQAITPRNDLINRAETALGRLPPTATPTEMGRVALAILGPATASDRRSFLEVLGMSGPDAKAVVKTLYPPRRKPKAPEVERPSAEPPPAEGQPVAGSLEQDVPESSP